MRKNSAAADPKARVGELQRRTQDARKRAEAARKEARDAKQRAREARRLFKEAKKVAKKARGELAALSKKLKKLIDSAHRAAIDVGAKPKAAAAESVAKSKKSTRKVRQPKQAKARQGKKKASKSKSRQPPQAKASTLVESAAAETQGPTQRRSRSTRKSITNGSVEAVVDATRPGETPARTSEETVVEPEGQNTPEESAA